MRAIKQGLVYVCYHATDICSYRSLITLLPLHDQSGVTAYDSTRVPDALAALSAWQTNNQDPDSNVIGAYVVAPDGTATFDVGFFYNGPTPPVGLFENFTSIPNLGLDLRTRTFADFVAASNSPMYDNTHQYRYVVNVCWAAIIFSVV